MGIIKPMGGRLSFDNQGNLPALNGDICVCKCSPPPQLINSQTVFQQNLDDQSYTADVARTFNYSNSELQQSNLNNSFLDQNIKDNWITYQFNDGFDYTGMPCTLYFKSGEKIESIVNSNNILEFKGFSNDDFDYLHFTELNEIEESVCFSDELMKRI